MQPTSLPEQVASALADLGPVYVYIFEYRITHGYMHLALTGTSYHDRLADLYLGDCSFISGPTQGGPWKMVLKQATDNEGHPVLVLRSGSDSFIVHCQRASITLSPGRSPT